VVDVVVVDFLDEDLVEVLVFDGSTLLNGVPTLLVSAALLLLADDPELLALDELAALLVLEPVAFEVGFTCWVKGLRSGPLSRALLGVVVTLTAGTAGAGAPEEPDTASGATTVLLPPLDRSTGTAIRATISATATGQSRFLRRSEIRLFMKFMV
jgi:hypothetical protein